VVLVCIGVIFCLKPAWTVVQPSDFITDTVSTSG
jgi:hypothetical protein